MNNLENSLHFLVSTLPCLSTSRCADAAIKQSIKGLVGNDDIIAVDHSLMVH